MSKFTAGATKAKTAKSAPTPSGQPTHATAKSDPPSMAAPEALREMVDKGAADAGATYEKANGTTAKGAAEYNLKVIEIARINTSTAFDDGCELLGVKSMLELIELSTAQARKRFATMTTQTKELVELAVKVTTEITEPFKASVAKAFNT